MITLKTSPTIPVIAAFGMLIFLAIRISAQEPQLDKEASALKPVNEGLRHNIDDWISNGRGVSDDWSHHHLVFSNPGTEEQAIANGTHDRWLDVINDPRYILQSLKRDAGAAVRPEESIGIEHAAKALKSKITRDWSMDMGAGATVGAGQYPAKYSFNINSTPSCTNDFVAFNTSLAGGSSQATIIAYNNIYKGSTPGCGTTGVPTIYWQYNTAYPYVSGGGGAADGSKIVTSVVLSSDGSQLAFMESNSSNIASLVILHWSASSSLVQMDTASYNVAPASYRTCSAPCMTRITFGDSHNDTNSAPFYDYVHDVLYVGDNSGVLHKFQNIFGSGTPGEVSTSPWPVTVSTQTAPTLTSPVYDSASTLVFVGDATGYLYSVNSSGTVVRSNQVAVSPGIVAGPLVDSAAEKVYVFVGEDVNGSNSGTSPCESSGAGACNGVFQFSATTSLSGASLLESVLGVGTPNPVYIGTFDNIYYTSSNGASPTGNLYWCGGQASHFPRLADSPITSGSLASGSSHSIPNGTAYIATTIESAITNGAATCSPVSEIYNSNVSPAKDWIFLSVSANANLTASGSKCSGTGCVYSFNATSTLVLGVAPANGLAATGGTSGIVIDNISTSTGASQVYLTPLSNESCAGNGTTGSGTGGCAVQASQAVLQ